MNYKLYLSLFSSILVLANCSENKYGEKLISNNNSYERPDHSSPSYGGNNSGTSNPSNSSSPTLPTFIDTNNIILKAENTNYQNVRNAFKNFNIDNKADNKSINISLNTNYNIAYDALKTKDNISANIENLNNVIDKYNSDYKHAKQEYDNIEKDNNTLYFVKEEWAKCPMLIYKHIKLIILQV